jgi:hypothetical protein
MANDLPLLLDRIRELVDESADAPPQPLLARMEHTLTDGYAHALALEAETLRIQKRIAELAGKVESREHAGELRGLVDRLEDSKTRLAGLRASLDTLRRRAERVRGPRRHAS